MVSARRRKKEKTLLNIEQPLELQIQQPEMLREDNENSHRQASNEEKLSQYQMPTRGRNRVMSREKWGMGDQLDPCETDSLGVKTDKRER